MSRQHPQRTPNGSFMSSDEDMSEEALAAFDELSNQTRPFIVEQWLKDCEKDGTSLIMRGVEYKTLASYQSEHGTAEEIVAKMRENKIGE